MEKKNLTVARKIELLGKEFKEKTRLIEAVRRLMETYEGDIVKLQNERNKIEHEVFMLEIEKRKEEEKEKCFPNTSQNGKNGGVRRKSF